MKKLGFTLAEVLITLVIIGVIAAMTVPTLMQNTNNEEFRTGLKKAISATNQALTLNYALEGMSAQDYTGSDASELINGVFKPRMSIVENPTFPSGYTICGKTPSNSNAWVTNDGMVYLIDGFSVADEPEDATGDALDSIPCNSFQTAPCGTAGKAQLFIDVNGIKKPNMATTNSARPRDQYQAQIYSQKIVPFGKATQEVMYGANTDIKKEYSSD